VEGNLKKVPGVESAVVNFSAGTATVVVSGDVTDELLTEAVASDGSFSATTRQ